MKLSLVITRNYRVAVQEWCLLGLLFLTCLTRPCFDVLADSTESTARKSSKAIELGSTVEDVNRVLSVAGELDKEFEVRVFEWPPADSRQLTPAYILVNDDDRVIQAQYPPGVSKIEPRTHARWQEVMGSPGRQVRKFRRAVYRWSFQDKSVFWGSFDNGKLSEKYAP